jgi:endoglucanase
MNGLSPLAPKHNPQIGRSTARQLVVVAMHLVGMTMLTSCDSPPKDPLAEEDHWDASYAQAGRTCSGDGVWTKSGCVAPSVVKLNTVGYLIGRNKLASVPADAADSNFIIRNVTTQQPIYSGVLSATPIDVTDTGDTIRIADFSDVNEPGTYVIEVGGVAASPQFEIGDTVYNDILTTSLLGLYGQRCGTSVSFEYNGDTFGHAACHMNDAQFDPALVAGMTGTQVATGGWHDAGDYGKYTVNGAFSVAFLLKAWEDFGQNLASINHIPKYTGSLPSILAEAKYEIDWLLKMQMTDGTALDLICPKAYPGDAVMPEADSPPRYFLPSSTADTSYFAAVVAMASRVFRPFDGAYADKLLTAAQSAMAWLAANSADVPVKDGTPTARLLSGGPYPVNAAANSPARTWASVELWRTSGEGDLTAIESNLRAMTVSSSWDWPGPGNLAIFDYATSDSTLRDAATVTEIQNAITTVADNLVTTAQNHGYGRAVSATDYNWGSNGFVARTVMNLQVAYRVSSDPKYLDAATQQVDYLLGRNPFGRSLVTGLGYAPPVFPHHRPSNGDSVGEPWPGLLVGGPHKDPDDPLAKANPDVPIGKSWYDRASDYYVNEIAINWNGPLVYAVAGFVK